MSFLFSCTPTLQLLHLQESCMQLSSTAAQTIDRAQPCLQLSSSQAEAAHAAEQDELSIRSQH
jgi:hypothetical protein